MIATLTVASATAQINGYPPYTPPVQAYKETVTENRQSPMPAHSSASAPAMAEVKVDMATAKRVLDRVAKHQKGEKILSAVKSAIAKINGERGDDPVAAAIFLNEAAQAEALANNPSAPKDHREVAGEDAPVFRFLASYLSGTVTFATSSSTSSSSSMTASGAKMSADCALIRTGTPEEILRRLLKEDDTLTQASRDSIEVAILAFRGGVISSPRMWKRGIECMANIAHSRIGDKAHWAKRLGSTAPEILQNADFFAKQDEETLRAAAALISVQCVEVATSTMTMEFQKFVPPTASSVVVQKEFVVTVPPPPVVTPPVVTTTVVTETTAPAPKVKATPKPCNTRVSVAPVNAK